MGELRRVLSAVLAWSMLLGMLSGVPLPAGAVERDRLTEPVAETVEETLPDLTLPETTAAAETVAAETVPEETAAAEVTEQETLPAEKTLLEGTGAIGGTCGESLNWALDPETGVLTISGTGEMYGYASGDHPWKLYRDQVKQVIVSEGAVSVSAAAFSGMPNLETAQIADSVMSVAYAAFQDSSALTTVKLPEKLDMIEMDTFRNCSSLTAIELPDSVTRIAYNAFRDCTGLEKAELPSALENIDYHAFDNCSSLTEIEIPDTVMTITYSAFENCTSLAKISLPEKLECIGTNAFGNCTSLTSIDFPTTLCILDTDAFRSCTGLKEIRFSGNAPFVGNNHAFHGVAAKAYYPADNKTWNEKTLLDYGGTLEWIPYGKTEVTRVSGTNRHQTAISSADMLKELNGTELFDTIVVADSRNFPDALAGSYLAAATNAPILLYQENQTAVTNYINQNLVTGGTVYVLGAEGSVPVSLEKNLKNDAKTVRLAGSTRYDTCLKILEQADKHSGGKPDVVLVCTGLNFADSLSASATGLPILLVKGTDKALSRSQAAYLDSLNDAELYVIGGKNTVSEEILNALHAYDRNGTAERVSGDSRESTSVAVAEKFFPDAVAATLANSKDFPDGLSGGPVAYALGAPLLLISSGKEADAAAYVSVRNIQDKYILGGPNSVTDKSAEAVFSGK